MDVRVACSPDADDLFMMRALVERRIDTGPYTFHVEHHPTDALNQLGKSDDIDVLAISIASYPKLSDRWQLLPHGGSAGEGYGPVVIAPTPMSLDELEGKRVGVPGLSTTAFAVLRMMVDVEPVITPISPYALVFDALREGRIDAGLVIHEGRLTFEDQGFHLVADLGKWWDSVTGLPLPLGGNTIRRALGPEHIAQISAILRASILDGLADRDAALDWLLARSAALTTRAQVSHYLDLYANQRTVDWGEEGRAGIAVLLEQGTALGLWPEVDVDFAP